MPKRILKSHRIKWAMLIFASYWAITPFVNAIQLAQVLMLILLGVVVGVLIKYFTMVLDSVLVDDKGPVSQLSQGIWLGFFGLGLGLIWSTISRTVSGAEWMMKHPVVGFYLICYIVAGTLHMTARRDENGNIRREDLRDVLICFATGLVMAILLLVLQLGGILRNPA